MSWSIRYVPGSHLAEEWGDGPIFTFATRAEAEAVCRACVNAEWMEVIEG